MKTLSAFILLIAGFAGGMPSAIAQNISPSAGKPEKKATVKKASAAKKPASEKINVGNEKEPDVTGLEETTFDCELGNKLTIYQSPHDSQQIALRWNKRLHEMTRVITSTGANRFESPQQGLVWIGIPAKGMLLDSKKGRQLANECKSAEQAIQKVPASQSLGIAP